MAISLVKKIGAAGVLLALLLIPARASSSAHLAVVEDTGLPTISAGFDHACSVLASGHAVCWGDNVSGMAVAPPERLRDISAGLTYTCGLGWSGEAFCWGSASRGSPVHLIPPSSARFTSISTGASFACGLTASGRVKCWNDGELFPERRIELPGTFRLISAGAYIACGVTTMWTVSCWYPDGKKVYAPASGSIVQVSTGQSIACGLQVSGAAICWTSGAKSVRTIAGPFRSVAAGVDEACGIRRQGRRPSCWGAEARALSGVPPGRFRWVSLGSKYACGLQMDQSLSCWGFDRLGATFGPKADFTVADTGSDQTCALRRDRSIICFRQTDQSPASAILPGRYIALNASRESPGLWCAVRVGGSLVCWDEGDDAVVDNSTRRIYPGHFINVAVGGRVTSCPQGSGQSKCQPATWICGVRVTRTAACFDVTGKPPAGAVRQLSVGNGFACALLLNRHAACWGVDTYGQTTPPAKTQFLNVSVGIDDACGVALSHKLVCWGNKTNPATKPLKGRFDSIELMPFFGRGVGGDYACGLTISGHITCWGTGTLTPPNGRFDYWSLGLGTICGVDDNGSLSCQGDVSLNIPYVGKPRKLS